MYGALFPSAFISTVSEDSICKEASHYHVLWETNNIFNVLAYECISFYLVILVSPYFILQVLKLLESLWTTKKYIKTGVDIRRVSIIPFYLDINGVDLSNTYLLVVASS